MSHIVESCPLTKLNGGLSRLHSAERCFVADQLWLMTRIREEEELDYTFDCAPLVIEISIIALKTNTYLCECDYDHIHVFSKFLVQD